MIELSRTQDEEVGDGTTSVIVLGKIRSMLSLLHRVLFYSLAAESRSSLFSLLV